MDSKTYMSFIKKTIATEGNSVVDKANKIALQTGEISTDLYLKAAQLIVKELLK